MPKDISENPSAKSAGEPNSSSTPTSSTASPRTYTRDPNLTYYAADPDGGPPNGGQVPGVYQHKATGKIKTVPVPPLASLEELSQPSKNYEGISLGEKYQSKKDAAGNWTMPPMPPDISPWLRIGDWPPPPDSPSSSEGQKGAYGGDGKGFGKGK